MNWQLYLVLGTPLLAAAARAVGAQELGGRAEHRHEHRHLHRRGGADREHHLRGPADHPDEQFFVDSLNVFLVALTAFVSMTTSLFSRPYMRIEHAHGKLSDNRLRLFHSMYQLFVFTMLLVLLTNNLGILWVALEAATLTTVLLVSLYRTPASLEAAWKYFILCGVGIAQALFGTILLYSASEKCWARAGTRCCGRIWPRWPLAWSRR